MKCPVVALAAILVAVSGAAAEDVAPERITGAAVGD